MNLTEEHKAELRDLVVAAVKEAGKYIASEFGKQHTINRKKGAGSLAASVVTEVDLRSEAIIVEALSKSIKIYDLGLLTEENPDDLSRLEKDYFWCIDPLDGTLSFTEGNPGFAVSIALVSRKGRPVLGVVCDPITQNVYQQGEDLKTTQPEDKILHCYLDRSFAQHPDFEEVMGKLEQLAHSLSLKEVACHYGRGAVMNAIATAGHSTAVYFKLPKTQPGGGSIWDFAATSFLYQDSGEHVSDMSGNPLILNSEESTFMNRRGIFYASNRELGKLILTTLSKFVIK